MSPKIQMSKNSYTFDEIPEVTFKLCYSLNAMKILGGEKKKKKTFLLNKGLILSRLRELQNLRPEPRAAKLGSAVSHNLQVIYTVIKV